MLSLLDLIRWSLRQIRVRLLESILIILGISLGVAVIISVTGLIENFSIQTKRSMQGLNTRVMQLTPSRNNYYTDFSLPLRRIGRVDEKKVTLTYKDLQAIKEADIEGISHVWVVSERGEMRANSDMDELKEFKTDEERMKWAEENVIHYLLITPEVLDIAEVTLIKGDKIRESDVLNKNQVALIGDDLAQRVFGEQNPIGQSIQMNEGKLTIIGVVHREAEQEEYIFGLGSMKNINNSLLIPYYSYGYKMGYGENNLDELMDGIYLLAEENANLALFNNRLQAYVERVYGESISIISMFSLQEESKGPLRAVSKAIGILACAALLISAINILNLMMARVLRRYKQIGIARAIGANKTDIFRVFLVEAFLLGIFGSVLGIFLGIGALRLLTKIIGEQISFTPLACIIGISVALLISLIFGIYPASQAAAIRPVDAFKKD